MNKRKMCMRNVQMADFALVEATLYLDGHPENQKALDYFQKHQKIAKNARREYETQFGPLTITGVNSDCYWDWIDGPWPWEGED